MATVKETYKNRQTEIKYQIKNIQAALTKHAEQFKKNDTNWGFVGDLGHVKEVLSELDGFLKSTKK